VREHREKLVFPLVRLVALLQEVSDLVLTFTRADGRADARTERIERDGTLEQRDVAISNGPADAGRSVPATTMTGKSDHGGCVSTTACRLARIDADRNSPARTTAPTPRSSSVRNSSQDSQLIHEKPISVRKQQVSRPSRAGAHTRTRSSMVIREAGAGPRLR
jgi:hypothetical protein